MNYLERLLKARLLLLLFPPMVVLQLILARFSIRQYHTAAFASMTQPEPNQFTPKAINCRCKLARCSHLWTHAYI